ncbi:barren [Suhomyces tanzawaensis NRRL Y-17324]|uniref:Condensin complex subunit 2 n=1 Tax=Suhomyces tanzawaensis NRRL Y-17324 TaxID=984487 RepID=A0A1E4SC08_9ASCO|nr:barren [Suhomyces tanzawaensis NRRL Y-17324]ODV76996.1 barren [Suhomyces tanzawaensis NRRL Y-17324]
MSSQVLPKKRALQPDGARSSSGADRRMVSNRVLSKRAPQNPGGNRVLSNRVISNNRHVSRGLVDNSDLNDSFSEENAIHFNENKHTILSNFEEWIKLSTDNKITSKNSWQFALIDYFHDMNVIKDGENINFQRASATLDGCVKIYLSRVESAATETGKLLSGLAKKHDSEVLVPQEDGNEEENSDNEDAEDEGKRKRKYNRVVESTLVEFEAIQIKKLDQELSIDPLFKKALAEFDEGGAKSLLLNTLNIDASGRVIFDATSNPMKDSSKASESDDEADEEEEGSSQDKEIDISALEKFVFKDNDFESLTICPSLNEFNAAIENVSKAKSILNNFNTKILAQEEQDNREAPDIANDYGFGDFDAGTDNEEQGDDPAGDFGNDYNDFNDNDNNDENDLNDPINNFNQSTVQKLFNSTDQYIQTTTKTEVLDRDLMAYFDEKLNANWRGPEHWKVSALKKSKNLEVQDGAQDATKAVAQPSSETKKKKKEQVIIDFFDDEDNEDLLFEPPKIASSILLKRNDGSKQDNTLPDDIKYNSSRLTNLFTKPQVHILYFPNKESKQSNTAALTDENFFAEQYQKHEEEEQERLAASFHQAEYEDFNNDFGGDDDFQGIDFNDALQGTDSNPIDDDKNVILNGGSQVLGRKRPDNINFSRVAKRVDVKLLKDNLWKTIKKEEEEVALEKEDTPKPEESMKEVVSTKTFGNVVTSIAGLYGNEQRKDLSTSFCFICLLHLANEHGLLITSNEQHNDLQIAGF